MSLLHLPPGYAVRGNIDEPGPIVITGRRIPGEIDIDEDLALAFAAAEAFNLPCARNVHRLAYYRTRPDKPTSGHSTRTHSQSKGEPSSHSGGSPHLPEGA